MFLRIIVSGAWRVYHAREGMTDKQKFIVERVLYGLVTGRDTQAEAWRVYHDGNMTDEQQSIVANACKPVMRKLPKPGVPVMLGT